MQSKNSSSQCQLFQLHIDAFLDNELEAARTAELERHLLQCDNCRQELIYAQRLHSAVVSLPILDCSDRALEPVDRLFVSASQTKSRDAQPRGMAVALDRLLGWIPVPLRLAVPVGLTLMLVVGLNQNLLSPVSVNDLAQEQAPQAVVAPQYSQAEIVQALQDLELALDYLGQISARTEVMIEDRFLLQKLQETMNASLYTDPQDEPESNGSNGPI